MSITPADEDTDGHGKKDKKDKKDKEQEPEPPAAVSNEVRLHRNK